jgi:hypothetical protein
MALFVLVLVTTRLYVPLPANAAGGRSISTHALAVTLAALPSDVTGRGALAQVTPVSVHVPVTFQTRPPIGLGSVVKRRSRADVTLPLSPVAVNLRKKRYSGDAARTWSVVSVP